MNIKNILGYFIIFLHIIILPFSLIIYFFVNNFYINFLLIIYYTIGVIGWIFSGVCLLTPIENYLIDYKLKNKDGTDKTQIPEIICKYTSINPKYIYNFTIYIPFF
jgi:hypothetical protein